MENLLVACNLPHGLFFDMDSTVQIIWVLLERLVKSTQTDRMSSASYSRMNFYICWHTSASSACHQQHQCSIWKIEETQNLRMYSCMNLAADEYVTWIEGALQATQAPWDQVPDWVSLVQHFEVPFEEAADKLRHCCLIHPAAHSSWSQECLVPNRMWLPFKQLRHKSTIRVNFVWLSRCQCQSALLRKRLPEVLVSAYHYVLPPKAQAKYLPLHIIQGTYWGISQFALSMFCSCFLQCWCKQLRKYTIVHRRKRNWC